MKRLIVVALLLAVIVMVVPMVALAAGLAQAPSPIDPTVAAFVLGAVTFVLTFIVDGILKYAGIDLSAAVGTLAVAVTNVVLGYLTQFIFAQPLAAQPIISQILVLIVSLVVAYGVHFGIRMFTNPKMRARWESPTRG